ncbi:MAG: antagonist of KipI [Spirosomataceae bacterium]|jgi:antagonist of KipI
MKFFSVGLQPTFQDLGRFGSQSSGINPDGIMDAHTLRLLNILLQNDENEGVLEMNFPAPKLLFEENATICIGGVDFNATLNQQPVPIFKTVNVSTGDVLEFPKKISGERMYLAVKGGFDLEKWLDSVSYNQAVKLPDLKIEKGLSVELKTSERVGKEIWLGREMQAPLRLPVTASLKWNLRFLPGPEYDFLTNEAKQKLQSSMFQITKDANRMGYRLEGEALKTTKDVSLLSSAVTFGTMQLLPGGQLIVLMASHQTTGGYPNIGTIISTDLPALAQSGPGQLICFKPIPFLEAENLHLAGQKRMRRLKISVKLASEY